MDNSHQIIGIIAGILALLGYVPYIISILKNKTRPNRATWFIWSIVGGLLAFSYMSEGSVHAIWVPIGYFIGPLTVAALSIRYGYAQWSKVDTICLVTALISIIPWIFSKDATITLLINVFIDMAGALPTLVKTYHEPETEDLTAWAIFFLANTLELFAITAVDLSLAYPIYLFILASSMVALILRRPLQRFMIRQSIKK